MKESEEVVGVSFACTNGLVSNAYLILDLEMGDESRERGGKAHVGILSV